MDYQEPKTPIDYKMRAWVWIALVSPYVVALIGYAIYKGWKS